VSLNFKQVITRGEDLLCKGNVRIACLDAETLKPKTIPEDLLQQLI